MSSQDPSTSKILRILSIALTAVFVSQTLAAPAAMADAKTEEFETFDKELDDLDAKIQEHLKKAREASFWKQEHTVAQPGSSVGSTVNLTPKNKTVSPAPAQAPTTAPAPRSSAAPAATAPAKAPSAPVYSGSSSSNIVPAKRPATEASPAPAAIKAPVQPSKPAAAPAVVGPAAPAPDAKQILNQNYADMDEVDREIASRTRVSGTYRAAMGVGRNRNFSLNDSTPDLQDRDFHYLFGNRQYNTFDPAIYSQYRLDIDSQVTKTDSVFVQLVADPWSYVGQTSEIVVPDSTGTDSFRIKQKYWGANNSTIPYIVNSRGGNSTAMPELEAQNGHTQSFTTAGFGFGNTFTIPEQEIDYEFRPLRKAWWDHEGDIWHVRLFALADQNQVMTTDDPMQLSNKKDFWQGSAWLDQWMPLQQYTMNGFAFGAVHRNRPVFTRGHYSEDEAFYARDSEGNYLTLLRGGAVEADFGRTYMGAMVASRYGLWDEYQEFDNIPGVFRLKHQVTEPWMVGATYTYRVGLVDREPDAYNQVISVDTKYYTNETDYMYGQVAGSRNDIDRLSSFQTAYEGQAYKTGFVSHTGNTQSGITRWNGDFSWIGTKFKETLSKYASLRDDEFWGNHISWAKTPPDVDPFKIGTGEDYGRYVFRLNAASSFPDKGVDNLFDIRHVRATDSNGYTARGNDDDESHIETVIRDETTWKFAPEWTFKNFMRFHILPPTVRGIEPLMTAYNPPQLDDPALESAIFYENTLIQPDLNANRYSFGQGLQWEPDHKWTVSGTFEVTNDIPEFPRGLLNNTYLTSAHIDPYTPSWALYRQQAFLYRQDIFGLPPYDYFTIVKERVVYRHTEDLQFIFHAAQNTYTLWAPVDDNVEHQGISVDWQITDRWSAFFDYTHTHLADVPKLIANNFTRLDFDDHHNIYTRLRYRINTNAVLTAEYGAFGQTFYEGSDALPATAYAVTTFALPTVDTEHLFRLSLDGEF